MSVNILKLVEIAQRYHINKNNNGFFIYHKEEEVMAIVDKNYDVKYYVTGVCNTAFDEAEINMQALKELQEFCELVINFNREG